MYEREDINICGLGMQHEPFVQYTNFIVPPKDERKPEWWILGRLEQALGYESVLDDLSENEDAPNLFGRLDHMMKHSGVSIEDLKEMPSQTRVLPSSKPGPFFAETIQTESHRVNCCPDVFTESLEVCESIFNELQAEENQLKMISRRTNYMVNSWFHNVPSLKRPNQLNNPLYMHCLLYTSPSPRDS